MEAANVDDFDVAMRAMQATNFNFHVSSPLFRMP